MINTALSEDMEQQFNSPSYRTFKNLADKSKGTFSRDKLLPQEKIYMSPS